MFWDTRNLASSSKASHDNQYDQYSLVAPRRKFIFTKHYFWFAEEPSSAESLTTFLRSEKADAKHSAAAWARETGKGLLFFSKRVEDKATPAGVINLVSYSTCIYASIPLTSLPGRCHVSDQGRVQPILLQSRNPPTPL